MKKFCEKCQREVPENEVLEIGVELIGGQTLEPQIFEHETCGGELA